MRALERIGRVTASPNGFMLFIEEFDRSKDNYFELHGFKARPSTALARPASWQVPVETREPAVTSGPIFTRHAILLPILHENSCVLLVGLSGKLWGYTRSDQARIKQIGESLWLELCRLRYVDRLEETCDAAIRGWAQSIENRERVATHAHFDLAADWAVQVAKGLDVKEPDLSHLRRGAILHDVGKMFIPDEILCKKGTLTPQEWEIVRRHPLTGAEMITPLPLLRPSADVVLSHHERWDGSGYPHGLRGEEIPLAGRLMALADVYDALVCARVYKPAFGHEEVCEYIRQRSGTHFDPDVVAAFLARADEFARIAAEFGEHRGTPGDAAVPDAGAAPSHGLS